MEAINVLSLFDGMSCGRIALDRANIPVNTYFSSEIDKYAIQIANKNYPQDTPFRLGDVTKIDLSTLPKIDLLIGGSPCQSFSRAGNGSGFDGKSKLFWEYVKTLKEVKPTYFLLENVVMKKEWENIITEALGVKPILINSSLVSAQKRERLYWTNIPNVTQPKDTNTLLKDILEDNVHPSLFNLTKDELDSLEYLSDCIRVNQATKLGYAEAYEGDSINLTIPKSKTRRGRVGNQKCNTLSTSHSYKVVLPGLKIRGLSITECERLQTVPDGYTTGITETQRLKMLGNGWTIDVIAHILRGINV